ncbi:hypothetical protein D9613_011151 [Agrocybe pediades]|uniref:AB hydrolase-1 domain-containing protein n=1 Tax=Agrocybe pediades TaxID=84607 RepID=A0A8H4QL08_9AGAR|nr:hypothetical protein D9613_011151 [Agrocybe pediades]
MKANAYDKPPPFTWDKVQVREPLPVYPPPGPLVYPELPSRPRKPAFEALFTLSTHIFPACHLRTTRPVPVPTPPPANASKEERRRILAETRAQLDAYRTTKVTDGYPRLLWNCVNRYVKNDLNEKNRTGVTLFFAHANGFPKEIFEPTLRYLLSSPAANVIDEIWVWESVQHGDAGLLNAKSATGLFDWYDNARDISNFLLHFMPTLSSASHLPTHLPRVEVEETKTRLQTGFQERRLMAIGHSYGGCTSTLAATIYPQLFDALYLIDPVILQPYNQPKPYVLRDLASGALNRRETWSSREEAYESFKRNPFFAAWDDEVLKIYVECGLYETTDESGERVAKLKMPGVQEAVVFAEVHTEHEVFDRLSRLDDRIAIRWAMPGKPGAPELGRPGDTKTKVWVRPNNATNTRILGGGHLIPQEAPQELAEDLKEYVLERFTTPLRANL